METWSDKSLLLQAAEYFKRPGFKRLFKSLGERYKTLSRIGGTVRLSNLTKEEAEALQGFLQTDISEGQRLSLSVLRIRKALANTRYDQCALEELVPLVLEEAMVTNKEEEEWREEEQREFFDGIIKSCRGTPGGEWLSRSICKAGPVRTMIRKDYNRDRGWLEENLPLIICGINNLPAHTGEYARLPVFAAEVTGNPHYFDEGKRSFHYLLYGIRSLFGEAAPKGGFAEARAELLYKGGILKDDLYNWVLSFGIRGWIRGGKLHEGMEEYLKKGEAQILTLQNLSFLESADGAGKKVYVVENPSVFSYMISRRREKCSCICSGGQLRLAVLVLLDLLAENGVTIYYSGDFDPEGLCIAQKLISRYGDRLRLWNYDEKLYEKAVSSESISSRRLAQLKGITDSRLAAIGALLQDVRRPGYQENIMDSFG